MKPLVTLALACALFSGVYALDCYECLPTDTEECLSDTTETCPASETNCVSATVGLYIGDFPVREIKGKSCAPQAECVNGSLNFGMTRMTINTKCCSTDLCNSAQAPELPDSSPNGKKCFTCAGNDCTVECMGSEDHCMKSTVSTGGQAVTMKGCASKSICSGSLNSLIGSFVVNLNCCEGNLCNNALRIGQSVLFLLLVPLASVILFN